MIHLSIQGRDVGFFRSPHGNYEDKFNRAVKLAKRFDSIVSVLDGIAERGHCETDNARLAVALKLMMFTGIRVGNEDSAEGYITKPHPNSKVEPHFVQTYGLTTITADHVTIKGRRLYLNFLGKKQVENSFEIRGLLAQQVRKVLTHDLETVFEITAYELTNFIHRHVGRQFSPKDFRTMRANILAYEKVEDILERDIPQRKSEMRAEVKEIFVHVSEGLCNTPGVCKLNYVDPKVIDYVTSERHS